MMDLSEILKKVRELEIRSKRLTRNIFSGEYHSAFKGRGMHFKEVREYQPGDDIRFIDWNVSARMGHPFSKMFEEERELTLMLMIDLSNSTLFGTHQRSKRELMTEMAAVIAFSAQQNNDKVGALFFTDRVELYIPPKKGREHILFIIRQLITCQPKGVKTDLNVPVRFFTNAIKQSCIAFLMSDFMTDQYDDALRIASKKHDLIGIKVYDKLDVHLPRIGLLQVKDAETGLARWIDSSDSETQFLYHKRFEEREAACTQIFKRAGADLLYVRTDADHVPVLQKFFLERLRRNAQHG
jgi:uncharacterized protein (DUF58 family)